MVSRTCVTLHYRGHRDRPVITVSTQQRRGLGKICFTFINAIAIADEAAREYVSMVKRSTHHYGTLVAIYTDMEIQPCI